MAWDVAMAGQTQVRIAPSGHIVGFDLPALFALGQAMGADAGDLAALLPAIEAGMLSGVKRQRPDETDGGTDV